MSFHLLCCGAAGFSQFFVICLSAAALEILKRYLSVCCEQAVVFNQVIIARAPKVGCTLKYGVYSFTYFSPMLLQNWTGKEHMGMVGFFLSTSLQAAWRCLLREICLKNKYKEMWLNFTLSKLMNFSMYYCLCLLL